MAPKPKSFLSLPSELRQTILLERMNTSLSSIYEPGWKLGGMFAPPAEPLDTDRAQEWFVMLMNVAFEELENIKQAVPEVREDVDWVANTVRMKLTETAEELDLFEVEGESLDGFEAKILARTPWTTPDCLIKAVYRGLWND